MNKIINATVPVTHFQSILHIKSKIYARWQQYQWVISQKKTVYFRNESIICKIYSACLLNFFSVPMPQKRSMDGLMDSFNAFMLNESSIYRFNSMIDSMNISVLLSKYLYTKYNCIKIITVGESLKNFPFFRIVKL